ncbi:uncharacterized protein MELLADRAFT_105650 [Melampsora larici-populina 98AG31]|uniref:Secreted protein n=1 Tax=Melampsora larici-populina (strain 98AG31 / pathotype 3-4-7) TaxID=747676 RepID=F4RIX2_MELLP|nr:uncharacterized protein MELLADRAFT_105650 [Melampsora larici-populina 98AG31]EGG07637.1 hypothetical protein MELLADRAFT_105650 [Melampsora larici-populina 98AG31]
MIPDCLLDIIYSEFFLYHIGPILLLYITVSLISPKVLRPIIARVVLLLVSFLVIFLCVILIWSISYFSPKEERRSSSPLPLPSPSPSRLPTIIVTPPTEDHITNLPPAFEEQDQNFLTTLYLGSRPMRGRSNSRASSFAPGFSRSRSRSPAGSRRWI